MSLSHSVGESRTAQVGHKRDASSSPARDQPLRKHRKSGEVGVQDVRDFVPSGGLPSSSRARPADDGSADHEPVSPDEDRRMAGFVMDSSSDGDKEPKDPESANGYSATLFGLATASRRSEPTNWNTSTTPKIRTSLGRGPETEKNHLNMKDDTEHLAGNQIPVLPIASAEPHRDMASVDADPSVAWRYDSAKLSRTSDHDDPQVTQPSAAKHGAVLLPCSDQRKTQLMDEEPHYIAISAKRGPPPVKGQSINMNSQPESLPLKARLHTLILDVGGDGLLETHDQGSRLFVTYASDQQASAARAALNMSNLTVDGQSIILSVHGRKVLEARRQKKLERKLKTRAGTATNSSADADDGPAKKVDVHRPSGQKAHRAEAQQPDFLTTTTTGDGKHETGSHGVQSTNEDGMGLLEKGQGLPAPVEIVLQPTNGNPSGLNNDIDADVLILPLQAGSKDELESGTTGREITPSSILDSQYPQSGSNPTASSDVSMAKNDFRVKENARDGTKDDVQADRASLPPTCNRNHANEDCHAQEIFECIDCGAPVGDGYVSLLRCKSCGLRHVESLSRFSTSATAPNLINGKCDLCNRAGHDGSECDRLWRSHVPSQRPLKVRALPVSCYNCGQSTHYGGDCPTLPNEPVRLKVLETFCHENASVYLDPNSDRVSPSVQMTSQLSDSRAPVSIKTKVNQRPAPSNDDSDEDQETFFRPSVAANRAPRRHIHFGGEGSSNRAASSGHALPGKPPNRKQESYRDAGGHGQYDSYRVAGNDDREGPRSPRGLEPVGLSSGFGVGVGSGPDRGRPSRPKGLVGGRGSSSARGGRSGRGGDRGAQQDVYRPMPSAASNAWRKHRI